nr:TonB-dependent receptor [Parvularcula dongshanensis]
MRAMLLAGAAVTAIGQAGAQENDDLEPTTQDEYEDTIIVTGSAYQRALADALNEKRNAGNIIEAVSTEDIGKLPEISIAESLARLPGLATNRDRGNGTELSIRGLGPDLSNTLLNGREIVSGEASRNVRYEQYPGELLTGAYVFKSPTASQVEGGVGGTVDLRTVRPLSYSDRRMVVNLRGSYFDLGDDIDDADTLGYTGSVSFIDQFANDTIGVAVGYARRVQPITTARTNVFPYVNSFSDLDGDGVVFDFPNQEFDGDAIPTGFEYLVRGGEDVRDGAVAAVQWQPNDQWEVNLDGFWSTFDFRENQRGMRVLQLPFGNSLFDAEGADGYVTALSAYQNENGGAEGDDFGLAIRTVNEEFTYNDDLYATGVNVAWENEGWRVEGDLAYSWTQRDAQFVTVQTEPHYIDESGTPNTYDNGQEVSFRTDGGVGSFTSNVDLTDPSINLPFTVEVPDSDTTTDELLSGKLDVAREFTGFLTALKFGARFTDREKELVARSDYPYLNPADRRAVPGNLLGDPLVGFGSFENVPSVLTYDIYGVIDELFGGIDPQQSSDDLITGWVVEENLTALYGQADFEFALGAIPVTGNVGARWVKTGVTSSGYQLIDNGDGNPAAPQPVVYENEFSDWLPSLNLSFNLTDNQKLRLALARAIARPALDDLRAGIGIYNYGTAEGYAGNPFLEPFRTDQIDLSYEYYFPNEGALTLAGFYKDVDTFIVRQTEFGVPLAGQPDADTNQLTQPVNGTGGYIQGIEASYQQPLSFLPSFLSNLGVYGNYTYIDSDISVNPAFVTGSYPLPGLSPHTFNGQLWYYDSGFEARFGYRYRDSFATELGDVPGQVLFNDSEEILDFQMSYTFQEGASLEGLRILFQANNLTNEPFQTYYANEAARARYEEFGRRFWAGFSYEF